MIWRLLAEVTVGVHFAFLAFLVAGGFLAWRWIHLLRFHVAAAVWGLLIVTTHVACPLTWAQDEFRARAGLPPVEGGFITVYVKGTVYPARLEVLVQVLVAAVVLASWVGLAVRRRRRRAPGPDGVDTRQK